jgi:hypothetical protein
MQSEVKVGHVSCSMRNEELAITIAENEETKPIMHHSLQFMWEQYPMPYITRSHAITCSLRQRFQIKFKINGLHDCDIRVQWYHEVMKIAGYQL